MKVNMVAVSELKPYINNPKAHPDSQIDKIAASIREFGFLVPLVVDADMGIVAGHGRLLAAKKLGIDEVPCVSAEHLTTEHIRAYRLADNRIAEKGYWIDELLHIELSDLYNFAVDLDMLGFNVEAIERLDKKITNKQLSASHKDVAIKAGAIEDLKPLNDELAFLKNKKFLIEFSGGIDSSASAVWTKYYFPEAEIELVFADLGADFVNFNIFLATFSEAIGVSLKILRSNKNIIQEFIQRKEWPVFNRPYCKDILNDTLDEYYLTHDSNEIIIVRGGRLAEKAKKTKVAQNRFYSVNGKNKAVERYMFFQPCYFSDKATSQSIIDAAELPIWQGYQYGLQRTACRICPGQRQQAYAAIKVNYPEVWEELMWLQDKFGPGCWQGQSRFEDLAQKGMKKFTEGGYRRRDGLNIDDF